MNENLLSAIQNELALCYEAIGRKSVESAPLVASSILDAIGFANVQQVHETFKRAKDIEPIPSQRTLKECFKNYGEEFLKYENANTETKALEYFDPLSAWLPNDDIKRRVNERTAIKNYCDAIGGMMPYEYMKAHLTTTERSGDRKIVRWANADKVKAFDDPIREYLLYLYEKHLRNFELYANYPANHRMNLGIIPPTISQLKTMLKAEGQIQ